MIQTFDCNEELQNKIEKYSALKSISKSEAIRQLIQNGLDEKISEDRIINLMQIEFKKIEDRDKLSTERKIKIAIKSQRYIITIFHMIKTILVMFTSPKNFRQETHEQAVNEVNNLSKAKKDQAINDPVDSIKSREE